LKVCIVEVAFYQLRVVVEELPFAMELVFLPVPLIGDRSFGVVKGSVTFRMVVFPFSIIDAPSYIVKFAIAISLLCVGKSLIFGAIFVVLDDKGRFREFGFFLSDFDDWF
jgi:hypothetical protein